MEKIIYWLKKLGILRSGVYKAKGDAKKVVEMEVKSELYQSDKEIEKEAQGKEKKVSKEGKSKVGKIIFWIFVAIGVFFLLVFWGAGWSFWTIVGVLIWVVFLRWFWVHITSGALALGKILFLGAALVVLSFVFATPDEEGIGVDVKVEKNEKKSSESEKKDSDLEEGVEKDAVAKFLLKIEKDTKIKFSKIQNDEVVWTGGPGLGLQKSKSFTAENLSAKDFDKLQKFFLDLGADTGGLGFTFVPPAGTQSSGFALRDKEYSGLMCVLMGTENDGVIIGCGWGPTNNPNSK